MLLIKCVEMKSSSMCVYWNDLIFCWLNITMETIYITSEIEPLSLNCFTL